ncbi:unnamed protein product [Tuwongella immobilis]|uniref:Uncharacterized protein n=1 Tax=Tuwongella immobilis TaxID=692036 RepID=A0A6C2YRR4_9BACT|nr:unnamed protein product [Tuwongella immobilis]VTS06058.1 unnamed protein product [Tuwongella immobilis]
MVAIMMIRCPKHGSAGVCLFSRDLLNMQADGAFPEILTIEVKDSPHKEAFFRFNLSPREATRYNISGASVPFDIASCEIMEQLESMCQFCFDEQRPGGEGRSTVG